MILHRSSPALFHSCLHIDRNKLHMLCTLRLQHWRPFEVVLSCATGAVGMADQAYGLGCLFKNYEGQSVKELLVIANLCHAKCVRKKESAYM